MTGSNSTGDELKMVPENMKKLLSKLSGKSIANLFILLTVGILLVLCANSIARQPVLDSAGLLTQAEAKQNETTLNEAVDMDELQALEEKLSAAFSQIEGVGKTSVVITLQSGKELVIGADITTEKRQSQDETVENYQSKHIIVNNSPLVLKEIEPKIDGILIIAEGGGNPSVVEKLSKAAQALLNVPAHKIQVFKMQKK